eukprot:m.27633 g.27633  ORF g.27633 m.27633 type:complete len:573 (-) comp10289_c1_seq1:105-1823(-)
MKVSAGLLACALLALVCTSNAMSLATPRLTSGDNGGTDCAVCTIVVALIEQYAELHNATASAAMSEICNLLPKTWQPNCKSLIDEVGPYIIEFIDNRETPDVVCKGIKVCTGDCQLFPSPKEGIDRAVARVRSIFSQKAAANLLQDPAPAFCKYPIFKPICDLITALDNHTPYEDADGDGFSLWQTLRGSDWRGKDCDDNNAAHHPGARPIDSDRQTDSNCNGIYGVDPKTGTPYEDLFCADTQPMGMIALGDSATAHFHIPYQYLSVIDWTNTTFANIATALENEFDWPMLSSGTGFQNTTQWYPDVTGRSNSTYQVMRERNRCIHRDFQNIGVNGARAGSMNDSIVFSMKRSQTGDYPALVMYALIGNDVCNGHPDTLEHMTTPQEMHDAALDTLRYLDTQLPNGSHVFLMGLADGRILYDAMASRIHPIGSLHNDVTTGQVYDFLNCLSISPCRGWMNSNATLRNLTSEHAFLLSDVLKNITEDYTFNNFDTHYFPNPIGDAIKEWEAMGGQTWQLIEPVDGFHPNQNAQPLITDQFWKYIAANFPHLLPPVNPHNTDIERIFGDQGGY